MPRKMSDSGTMLEKIMKSKGDAGEGEEIRASSGEGSGQVPEKVESRRVSKRWNPGEYWRRVWASTGKG